MSTILQHSMKLPKFKNVVIKILLLMLMANNLIKTEVFSFIHLDGLTYNNISTILFYIWQTRMIDAHYGAFNYLQNNIFIFR